MPVARRLPCPGRRSPARPAVAWPGPAAVAGRAAATPVAPGRCLPRPVAAAPPRPVAAATPAAHRPPAARPGVARPAAGAGDILGGLPGPRLWPGPCLRPWPGRCVLGVFVPGLWLGGWCHAGVFGGLPGPALWPGPCLRPWPGRCVLGVFVPGLWLGGRYRAGAVGTWPRQRRWLADRDRGDGEGPGDVRGHLAQLSRQPDGARPKLVGLPGGGLAYRVGLLGCLPLYLLGLTLGVA